MKLARLVWILRRVFFMRMALMRAGSSYSAVGLRVEFLASQPRCLVALEACGGAHHWARGLRRMGHDVRLIPPAYVKPFVKRQKNDAADAEVICEAVQRPSMRFVAIKSEEQQASALMFRTREAKPVWGEPPRWVSVR